MKPSATLSRLRSLGHGQDSRETMLYTRLLLRFMADEAHEAQLEDGKYLGDVVDFRAWLVQCADEAAKPAAALTIGVTPAARICAFGCGHTHDIGKECGADLGGGRRCLCDR